MKTAIIYDKLYLPAEDIDYKLVLKHYVFHLYKEVECKNCFRKDKRFCKACSVCPSYQGSIDLFKEVKIKGVKYIGFPVGDRKYISYRLGISAKNYKITDRRVNAKFDYPVKFLLNLYDYQVPLKEELVNTGYGVLEAEPRTGKTAICLAAAIELGYKVVILAKQKEFLDQFIYHIEGNETAKIPKCTNLPELEQKYGKKLYGYPKKEEDFRNFQIMVMTYQQFMDTNNGDYRFALIKDFAGTLLIDECHNIGAPIFCSVVNKFPAKYKIGCTGTYKRKDNRHEAVEKVLGPIVVTSKKQSLTPTVYVHLVSDRKLPDKATWTYAMKQLMYDQKRNDFILNQLYKDIKDKRYILLPTIEKRHVFECTDAINSHYGKHVATSFVGSGNSVAQKKKREELLQKIREGEYRVTVAIRSLIQLGLNVPKWDCIYMIIPINNEYKVKQENIRVCTEIEVVNNKPIIRLFVDNQVQSLFCAKNTLKHFIDLNYHISDDEETKKNIDYINGKIAQRYEKSSSIKSVSLQEMQDQLEYESELDNI